MSNGKPRPLYSSEKTLLLFVQEDGLAPGRVCIRENIFVAFKGAKNFPTVLERSWNLSSSALIRLTEKFQVSVMASNLLCCQ